MSKSKFVKLNKSDIEKDEGVVVLPVSEYKKLLMNTAPTYQLSGKEAEDLDSLVKEGEKDFKKGNVKKLKSLADLG